MLAQDADRFSAASLLRLLRLRKSRYFGRMPSLSCIFGKHRVSLNSIVRRSWGYTALCERCGQPLERTADGHWREAEPLAKVKDRTA